MGARGTAPSSLQCPQAPSTVLTTRLAPAVAASCGALSPSPDPRPLCRRLDTTVSLSYSLSARRRHGTFPSLPCSPTALSSLPLGLHRLVQRTAAACVQVMEKRLLGRNEGRTDDNIETIRKRFTTFVQSTQPVVAFYASRSKARPRPGFSALCAAPFFCHTARVRGCRSSRWTAPRRLRTSTLWCGHTLRRRS